MRHRLVSSVLCCGWLAVGLAAYSQDRDDRYRDEDRYHRDARDESWWRGRLFQRVRDDIDHVQSASRFDSDQYRLDRVRRELDELQAKYVERGYDQPELDDVISALQRVVTDNRLSQRDRDMLSNDLSRLREFREHHEGYR